MSSASLVGRAESVNSLHLRERPIKKIKAAIQGDGCTEPHVAPAIKASNAQKADFAKFGQRPEPDIERPP